MSGNGKIMCNHGVNLFKCQTCIDALLAEQINLMQQRITKLEQQLKTARKEAITDCGKHIMQGLLSKQVNAFEFEEYANNLEGK